MADAARPNAPSHYIAAVERVGPPFDDRYVVVCICGWESRECDDSEPYRLVAIHAREVVGA